MDLEIIHEPLSLDIYGFAGTAPNRDYSGVAFRLMDRMWKVVKSGNLKSKGQNIWVYEPEHYVFAGVELEEAPSWETELEQKAVRLSRYASYTHVGPYNLISQSGQNMTEELKRRGYEIALPYIEIYGHWTHDEAKLETQLLMSLK